MSEVKDKQSAVIALLTDFGTEDGYVAAMKGRILSEIPSATILDISHQISPYNISQAAFCLNNCYAYYPEKTIFVVVVDPGVGTERKALVVETPKYHFVGPDNGVFSFIYRNEVYKAFEILLDRLPWPVSNTFHGRDVFAPIASHIAAGKNIGDYLSPLSSVKNVLNTPKKSGENAFILEVLHVDHFGNLILNFHRKDWGKLNRGRGLRVRVAGKTLTDIHPTFGTIPQGSLLLTWDSSGYLQIAQYKGNASRVLGLIIGDKVTLSL